MNNCARAAAALLVLCAGVAEAADQAVVFMYHRFGDSRYPTTNIRLDQFEAHLAELKEGGYRVLPLAEIADAMRQGRELPDRTVAITVDDAYASVYREGWPRLRDAGLPWTLFVATTPVDQGGPEMMTWDQIRELAAAGVVIGHHGASHASMAEIGVEAARRDIETASRRFHEELGHVPDLFAYPYGEAGVEVMRTVGEAGFPVAFGQHSGVWGEGAEIHYLPRFPLNENYGDMERFRTAANALALPVSEITPVDPLISGENPPAIGFTVGPDVEGLARMTCFSSQEGRLEPIRLGERRIELRLKQPLPPGRSRINCTLPGKEGRWHWFGRQYYLPKG